SLGILELGRDHANRSEVHAQAYFCPTTRAHIIKTFRVTATSGRSAAGGTSTLMPNCCKRMNGFLGSAVFTGTAVSAGRKPYATASPCDGRERMYARSFRAACRCGSVTQSPARMPHGWSLQIVTDG